jgi:putative resolvase
VKLAAWARSVGVHPQTAYAWVREDRMPVPFRRLPSGTILVDVVESSGDQRVVLYARVSSDDQKADLDRQTARLTAWATAAGFQIDQVVAEVGSGLGGQRPKLARILSDPLPR